MNAYPPTVLLGGWGTPLSMLAPLIEHWPGEQHRVALDRVERTRDPLAEVWLSRLMGRLPEQAVWIGWSLGGQLAMEAARRFPDRVLAVATLCSSPSFLARPDWREGMPAAEMADFRRRLGADAMNQWRRFLGLQILGDCEARQARRELRPFLEQGPPTDAKTLFATLAWLETLDQREFWVFDQLPRLHLLGDRDRVCRWRGWSREKTPSRARLDVIRGMAHWPRGRHGQQARERLEQFIGGLMPGRKGDQ